MSAERITLRDLMDGLDRLEEKFDKKINPLEERTRNLENNQNRAFGILSVVTVFIGAGSSYIWNKVFGKA